jgi:hypothetical protein
MATTIMISTNVKPDWRVVLFFMLFSCLSVCGVNDAAGGLDYCTFRSLIACHDRSQKKKHSQCHARAPIFHNCYKGPKKQKGPGVIPQAFSSDERNRD